MSGPGLNLSDMGIGTTSNADTATRPPEQKPTEADYLAELTAMVDNDEGVEAIEQASQWQAPDMRPLRPDTSQPRPVVIDPTADNQQQQPTGTVEGEGGGSNDAAPTGGELSDDTATTDGLPFQLPPTGTDQTASPGGDGGGATDTTPSQEQQQSAPTINLNDVATSVFGANITEDQARQIFRLAKDFESLDPGRLAAIDQIVNGGYGGYQQQPYQQPIQPQAPIPNPQPIQPNPQLPPTGYPQPQQVDSYQQVPQFPTSLPPIDDPDLQTAIAPLYAQQQQLAAQLQAQQQFQAQQLRMQQEREAEAARQAANQKADEWRAAKQNDGLLTDAEYLKLEQEAIRSGYLPVFNQQFGDAAKAVEATLDYLFSQDPTFQERVIQKKVQEAQVAQAQQAQRTNVSTALSGGGGAKPTQPMQQMNGNPRRPGQGTQNSMAALTDAIAEITRNN